MKHLFRSSAVLVVSAAVLLFASCKEDTVIKTNLAPSVDNIGTEQIDTITILSKTFYEDTVVTSNESSSLLVVHGLGKAYDPFFGLTNAGIYLQVVPEKAYYAFPTVIDSAFLVLPYSGFSWGDTSATDAGAKQVYNVYRVTDTMGRDTKYYSNDSKAYDPSPVGTITLNDIRGLKDSVNVLGKNRTPHLRIKLEGSFISSIVTDAATSGDNSTFLEKFRGLYIAPADTRSNSGKAISYFVINGANDYQRAAIQFFYFQDSVKNAFFSFASNSTAHFNKITRTYNQGVKDILNSTAESDEVVLLQNTPGTAIDLKFPYLKNLPQGVINKAELVITKISYPGDPDQDNKFFEPARIFPRGVEPGGRVYDVLDTEGGEAGLNFVDGTRKEVILPNGIKVTRYVINIPREVQRAIVNKIDVLHLRIYGVQRFFGAYRLIAGGKHSTYKVSLNIAYSKI